jgi:hypothetical protein
VHSGGRSSTGELLTYFWYIFTITGVLTFTICFFLQDKCKEEVVKKHGEGFHYEESIEDQAVYDNGDGKAHER